MTISLSLAVLIGLLAGLRSLTPPAAVAWAAHLGWLKLHGTLALIGSPVSVGIFSALAVAELAADKWPRIGKRTSISGQGARLFTGGLAGACNAVAGGEEAAIGAALGGMGGVAGAYAGYHVRVGLPKALKIPDYYVALLEDLVAIAGCLAIVTSF